MRHEVKDLVATIFAVDVGIERGQQCCTSLDPHPPVQGSPLRAILEPLPKLGKAHALLGFRDGAAEADGDFVPGFVEFGEGVVFPMLLTS